MRSAAIPPTHPLLHTLAAGAGQPLQPLKSSALPLHPPQPQDMPAKYIYEPWTAPLSVQQAAGCVIGKDYPRPIVDHATAMKVGAATACWQAGLQLHAPLAAPMDVPAGRAQLPLSPCGAGGWAGQGPRNVSRPMVPAQLSRLVFIASALKCEHGPWMLQANMARMKAAYGAAREAGGGAGEEEDGAAGAANSSKAPRAAKPPAKRAKK